MTCWRPLENILEQGDRWLLKRCHADLAVVKRDFIPKTDMEITSCSSTDLVGCLESWGFADKGAMEAIRTAQFCCTAHKCGHQACCCHSLYPILLADYIYQEAKYCFNKDFCSQKSLALENSVATVMWATLTLKQLLRRVMNAEAAQNLVHHINLTKQAMSTWYNLVHPEGFIPYSPLAHDAVLQLFKLQHPRLSSFVMRSDSLVFNPFTQSFGPAHAAVFQLFPPKQGPAPEGHLMDFLGIATKWRHHCGDSDGHLLDYYPPGRALDCLGHMNGSSSPQWPALDEEYFEWIDILHAVTSAAKRGASFAMAEVGSLSAAIWAVRAAVAFHQLAPSDASCNLVVLDPVTMKETAVLQEHLSVNLPEGRCSVATSASAVGGEEAPGLVDTLRQLRPDVPVWDLIDLDCQGAEHYVIRDELHLLASKVRLLHISTHGREIHRDILDWLHAAGWSVPAQFTYMSISHVANFKDFVAMDGHITAISPIYLPEMWLRSLY